MYLGELPGLRKMSLPDTVLFWFRSQIAQLSFYIDNKEMGSISWVLQSQNKSISVERESKRDRSFCVVSWNALYPDFCGQADTWGDSGWPELAPFLEPQRSVESGVKLYSLLVDRLWVLGTLGWRRGTWREEVGPPLLPNPKYSPSP